MYYIIILKSLFYVINLVELEMEAWLNELPCAWLYHIAAGIVRTLPQLAQLEQAALLPRWVNRVGQTRTVHQPAAVPVSV